MERVKLVAVVVLEGKSLDTGECLNPDRSRSGQGEGFERKLVESL